MFHAAPPPHQSRLRRASFPGGEAFVPCFRVAVLSERPRKALKNLPRRGRGTARRRWMRGGTALYVVGTMGAEVEAFLRIRLLFLECFTLPRPSSVRAMPCQLPRRGSFCTGLLGVGFTGTPQGSSQNLPHRGRGTARRRWMRGGTALYVVGTVGAEVKRSPHMSFRANAVSRGIHASCRFYLVVVHHPTWWIPPLRLSLRSE